MTEEILEISLELPWPDKSLSPNARIHHMEKASVKKAARELAYYSMLPLNYGLILPNDELVCVRKFYPPDNRKRDLDNMGAMCKAYQDGIFDQLDADDSQITKIVNILEKPVKDGCVVMMIYRKEFERVLK